MSQARGRERGQHELKSTWTDVGGVRTHALVAADGSFEHRLPVVLLSGFVVAAHHVAPAALRLAPRFPVYIVDHPGFGESDKPPSRVNVPALADHLVAWVQAANVGPIALVGSSVDCQVAADTAMRYPETVRRLVLSGPTMDPQARTFVRQTMRWLMNGRNESLVSRAVIKDYMSAGPRRVYQLTRSALSDRIEEKLPRISSPTLVLRGSKDVIVPQRWAEEVVALLPNGRLEVIPGGSHSLLTFAPDAFAAHVLPFLEEDEAARGEGAQEPGA